MRFNKYTYKYVCIYMCEYIYYIHIHRHTFAYFIGVHLVLLIMTKFTLKYFYALLIYWCSLTVSHC